MFIPSLTKHSQPVLQKAKEKAHLKSTSKTIFW